MDLNIHATADDLPSIFQGIGILPSQYGNMVRRKLPGEGERKLLFAVLEDAIRVYIKNRNRGEASRNDPDFIEAAEWLNSDEDEGPFTFSACAKAWASMRIACAAESTTTAAAWKRSAAERHLIRSHALSNLDFNDRCGAAPSAPVDLS